MRSIPTVRTLCLLLAAIGVGCDDKTTTTAVATSLGPTVFGSAQVRGVVRFIGDPPERKMIDTAGRCYENAPPIQEETIVVSPAGGLRDVIVYLKDAPASLASSQPELKLDQRDCRYVPHVLSLQAGQGLRISTGEPPPVFHNVQWHSDVNGNTNLGFMAGSSSQAATFHRAEFLRLRCDVHPWMEAWIGVFDHPFSATTDAAGTFTIPKVPAGKYTLAAWHPLLGERTQTVDVGNDGTTEVNFDYAPPTR